MARRGELPPARRLGSHQVWLRAEVDAFLATLPLAGGVHVSAGEDHQEDPFPCERELPLQIVVPVAGVGAGDARPGVLPEGAYDARLRGGNEALRPDDAGLSNGAGDGIRTRDQQLGRLISHTERCLTSSRRTAANPTATAFALGRPARARTGRDTQNHLGRGLRYRSGPAVVPNTFPADPFVNSSTEGKIHPGRPTRGGLTAMHSTAHYSPTPGGRARAAEQAFSEVGVA